MNPLTNIKNLQKLNERELELGIIGKKSWHDEYKGSAWIFIGGLPYDLSEGDIICVFSQYGEIVNINLVRDNKTGKSKGYAFICFQDQRSTVLSVDNLNGIKILGRVIRVDHVKDYKMPKERGDEDDTTLKLRQEGCAPKIESSPEEVEDDIEEKETKKKRKKEKKKKVKKEKKKKKKKEKDSSQEEDSDSSNESDNDEKHDRLSDVKVDIKEEKLDIKEERLDRGYDKALAHNQHSGKMKRSGRGFNDDDDDDEREGRRRRAVRDKNGVKEERFSDGDDRNRRKWEEGGDGRRGIDFRDQRYDRERDRRDGEYKRKDDREYDRFEQNRRSDQFGHGSGERRDYERDYSYKEGRDRYSDSRNGNFRHRDDNGRGGSGSHGDGWSERRHSSNRNGDNDRRRDRRSRSRSRDRGRDSSRGRDCGSRSRS